MSRIVVCAALFAASCLLVAHRAGPVAAQDKKDKKDATIIANLEKQLKAAQQDLNQGQKQFNAIKADVQQLKTANNKLQAENTRLEGLVKKGKGDDTKDDKTIKTLQTALDGYRGAGLVHVVVLKLKVDTSDAEAQSLIDDTYAQLAKIKPVRGVWAGKPAAKGTPDAAIDYTVALVLAFDDAAGLKTYLNDPAHTKFAEKHLKKWEAPVVYDIEPKKAP